MGWADEDHFYLEPWNKAGISIVTEKAFDALTFADLEKCVYLSEKIRDTDLKEGDVIVLKRVDGTYAKIRTTGHTSLHALNFKGSEDMDPKTRDYLLKQTNRPHYNMALEWSLYSK